MFEFLICYRKHSEEKIKPNLHRQTVYQVTKIEPATRGEINLYRKSMCIPFKGQILVPGMPRNPFFRIKK